MIQISLLFNLSVLKLMYQFPTWIEDGDFIHFCLWFLTALCWTWSFIGATTIFLSIVHVYKSPTMFLSWFFILKIVYKRIDAHRREESAPKEQAFVWNSSLTRTKRISKNRIAWLQKGVLFWYCSFFIKFMKEGEHIFR